ncbi:hypothetical protein F4677DRAFT_405059 [Hypoxylon crocopeplum]|nr:hypothetical protein F4677DRAFT_405059 [Hypoxylon crocopeplum]
MGKLEDTELKTAEDGDLAPPPYTEVAQEPHRADSTPDHNSHIPMTTEVSPYRPFPSVLHAHYQWKITMVFHLGEPANKRLFAVSTHTELNGKGPGKPGIVLHNGPTDKYPMLAAAGREPNADFLSLNSIIILPSLSGGTTGKNCTEIMRAGTSSDQAVFRFSIEVGQSKDLRRENFEWRKCKGDEVKSLVDPPWSCGFKLVRLPYHPGDNANSEDGTSSNVTDQNQEVIAIFAWNPNWSMMHPFKIEFRGSGQTGAMGERFSLMVVITGLRLWYLKHQGKASRNTIRHQELGIMPGR